MIKNSYKHLKTFLPFLGISAIFFLFVLVATLLFNYYLPNSQALAKSINPYYLLVRWDSIHYLNIVINNFQGMSVFFPLYSIITYIFSLFFPLVFSGFLTSFLSLSVALYYLYLLLRQSESKDFSIRTIILLLAFPCSLFLSLIYTESLFLALTVAFFYYIQNKRWLAAAIIGFFAVLTRNVGIVLWLIYLIYLILPNFSLKDVFRRKEFYYSLIIPAGLLSYCLFCYFQSGDFFAFINGQKAWSDTRNFMWPWQTVKEFFNLVFIKQIWPTNVFNFIRMVLIEGGSFLLLSAATIYWISKKHWTYSALCLFNVLLFSTMFPMASVNRYILVIFPVYIFLAKIMEKRNWLFQTWIGFSLLLLIFNVYLISIGAWVG